MKPDFKSAWTTTCDGKVTLSGIELDTHVGTTIEVYRLVFLEHLETSAFNTDEALEPLLEEMNEFMYVGDFLAQPESQLNELAAFGIILIDRIALTGWGKYDYEACFDFHEQLFECYEHVIDRYKRVNQAKRASSERHKKNRIAKKFVADEWQEHRNAYKNNKSDFSRHYVRILIKDHDVTITEKQLREEWLKDSPSASKPAC
jgi:hypothetical protein